MTADETMTSTIRPDTKEAVGEAIRWAIGAGEPLEVVGGGTKRAVSSLTQTAYTLDLSGLAGIVTYEPEELVLTVRPGTTMGELTATLDDAGQMLAFEPPDLAPLLNGPAGAYAATFGGAFGTNFAGPRRIAAGSVRDHMLGLEAVSGRGEAFKAGGKVVKNVTGYDLARALSGSWGTLAVATEMTVKVLPKPETETTVALDGLPPDDAVAAMAAALGSSADVSGAAHLPDDIAAAVAGAGAALTVLRIEGFGPSVEARVAHLCDCLAAKGPRMLDRDASRQLWQRVRGVTPFVGTEEAVWRISVPPSAGPSVLAAMPVGARGFLDWAGGLVMVAAPALGDAGAAQLRAAVAAAGSGHATLLRAPSHLRASVATFQPEAPGVAALSKRLRNAFDPKGILNPQRLARAA